jgi:6-pyruvoyltetrahydropterin/6-carboxytetrahydropterin synthase
MLLKVEFQFNAAHRLPLYQGPCFHTHGHNYQLVVVVRGWVNPATGLAVDFGEVKRVVRERVLERIDHNDLNEVLDNPTAENVIAWIWQQLEPGLAGLTELQLFETPDCAVIYRGEKDEKAAQAGA